jgi:hypothetical protein
MIADLRQKAQNKATSALNPAAILLSPEQEEIKKIEDTQEKVC